MWTIITTDMSLDEMREHYARLYDAGKNLEVSLNLLPLSIQKIIKQQCVGKDKQEHLDPGTTFRELDGKVILIPVFPHEAINSYYYNKCLFRSNIGMSFRTLVISAAKSKELFFYGREI